MEGGFRLEIFNKDDSSAMENMFVYNGSDTMWKINDEKNTFSYV